ncbi:MAG: segregation/condensation protein A [Thermoanaerobaculia bacterium]|nr:segregation/condensation protein A [Thermoanaerobaculia bacterium]
MTGNEIEPNQHTEQVPNGPEEESAAYRVSLPMFEGPLDLLLHLIKKHEIDIYDIPILLITDQYNEYLEAMEDLDLEIAADFIYMAALLIHIKSKMLLPRSVDEEGEPEEDPRQELVERLLEYQRFKAVAEMFAETDVVRMGVWTRPPAARPDSEPGELDLSEVSLFDLIDAFSSALQRYRLSHPEPIHFERLQHKVSDKMREMLVELTKKNPIRLLWYLEGRDRPELVAIFLGMLELVRLGGITLMQNGSFKEIVVHRTEKQIDPELIAAFDR